MFYIYIVQSSHLLLWWQLYSLLALHCIKQVFWLKWNLNLCLSCEVIKFRAELCVWSCQAVCLLRLGSFTSESTWVLQVNYTQRVGLTAQAFVHNKRCLQKYSALLWSLVQLKYSQVTPEMWLRSSKLESGRYDSVSQNKATTSTK